MEKVTLRAVALWAVAVLAAVGASTAAVTLATNSVTQPPAVGLASPSDATTPSQDTPSPDPSPTPAPTPQPSPPDDADDDPDGSGDPAPTQGDPGDEPSPSPSPTRDDDGPDDSSSPAQPEDQEQTATSIGGTARFRFAGGDVSVVFATPAQGFTVDVDDEGGEVRVTFTSADHESRIDADYEDGQPRVRVREEAEDD